MVRRNATRGPCRPPAGNRRPPRRRRPRRPHLPPQPSLAPRRLRRRRCLLHALRLPRHRHPPPLQRPWHLLSRRLLATPSRPHLSGLLRHGRHHPGCRLLPLRRLGLRLHRCRLHRRPLRMGQSPPALPRRLLLPLRRHPAAPPHMVARRRRTILPPLPALLPRPLFCLPAPASRPNHHRHRPQLRRLSLARLPPSLPRLLPPPLPRVGTPRRFPPRHHPPPPSPPLTR